MSIKITYLAKICLFLAAQRTAQMRKKERKIERKKERCGAHGISGAEEKHGRGAACRRLYM